jgi:8-oxo-dGTP diphosphatase
MTVPCGVGVAIIKERGFKGQFVLLGKRKGAHGAGQWSLPGGRLEPTEDPRECGAREVIEETGIWIHPQRLMLWEYCPFNNTITGGQPWLTIFYWVVWEETDGEPKLKEPDKCEKWRWFKTSELPSPLFEAFKQMAISSKWRGAE